MTEADKEGQRKAPILRFKGFNDDWEQRKLLKVCKKEDNKRIPIKEQERKEGNTPYFGANGIQGYIDGYTHDGTNILIAEDGANNVRNYPIKLITGKIWVNNHAHVLKVNTKTNNGNFLVGAIKKINFYRYLVGSSRYKLTAESLNQVKIKIAKQSEQEKIGKLLKNIEKLLTLYERKLKLLSQVKKYFLDNLFTEKEYPNLRFKGFTDAWEQRKLEDIVEKIGTGKSNFKKSKKDIKNIFPILGSTSIIGYDSSYDYDGNFILTARVGNAGNLYKYCGKAKISDNTIYIQSNEIEFSFPLLMHNNLKKLSFGSGRSLIKSSELKKYKVTIPNKNEKECIGNIFYLLDNLITLYENKKQNIIKIKKELLNTMFI